MVPPSSLPSSYFGRPYERSGQGKRQGPGIVWLIGAMQAIAGRGTSQLETSLSVAELPNGQSAAIKMQFCC